MSQLITRKQVTVKGQPTICTTQIQTSGVQRQNNQQSGMIDNH